MIFKEKDKFMQKVFGAIKKCPSFSYNKKWDSCDFLKQFTDL